MANLQFSNDIINDALFRSDEKTDGSSDYESQAVVYLNRAYRALYMGGTEFDPDLNEVWWWMKSESNFILNPSIKDGTVSVTENSASITFSSAPAASVAGYHFKATGHADVFKISAHTGGAGGATLDSVYTGETDATAGYRVFQIDYDLTSDAIKVLSPMRQYRRWLEPVHGISTRTMDEQYPLNLIQSGAPSAFSMIDEDTVRFNRFGSDDGNYIRVDYDYMARPSDLADDGNEPLVPRQYRHVLSDMLAFFILSDKEDDKALRMAAQAKSGLQAMAKENAVRWEQMGDAGRIYPRASDRERRSTGPLRTETGVIIG